MKASILFVLLLQTLPVPAAKISGHVVTLPGTAMPETLTLRIYGNSGSQLNLRPVPVNSDGRFEITGIGGGEFTLSIGDPFRSPGRNFTMKEVEVTDFEVKVPVPVAGRVQLADGTPLQVPGLVIRAETPVTAVNISRAAPKTMGNRAPAESGSFTLGAFPGDNTISVEQVPAGYSVGAITYNGFDALNNPLKINVAPTGTLVVTLNRR
jgi:hypothetical protein